MPIDPESVLRDDPEFSSSSTHGVPGGRRFSAWTLLWVGGGLAVGGAIAGQVLLSSWWNSAEAEAAPEVERNTQPDVAIRKIEDKPEPVGRRQGLTREANAAPPSTPVRPSGGGGPSGPTTIKFDLAVPEPPKSLTFDGTVPVDGLGCTLRPGANDIHAVLTGVVQSEVGGQATAAVMHDVVDADGYGRLLIPAGSKLLGVYKPGGNLRFGSERLPFVWRMITFPPGWPMRQARLPDAAGLDIAGSVGVGGEVTAHWGDIIAAAALFTVFDVSQRAATPESNSFASQLGESATDQFGSLGEDVTREMLNLEPDIRIAAGTPIIVQPAEPVKVSAECVG
jgi:hypothetical protein